MTKLSQTLCRAALALGLAGLTPAWGADTAPAQTTRSALPGDSIYQLKLKLTDQDGHEFGLEHHRGKPLLLSMFYTSCQFVCPMLIEALGENRSQLKPEDRERVDVLLVSFDPAHDSVQVLQQTAKQRQLDTRHWTLARTDAASVRKLAALLGIQYRALPNGDFNHTTSLILLDAEGRIAGRSGELSGADPDFVALLKKTVAPR